MLLLAYHWPEVETRPYLTIEDLGSTTFIPGSHVSPKNGALSLWK